MLGGKISKLVVVISSKDTGEDLERWQFDVRLPSAPFTCGIVADEVCRFNSWAKPPPQKLV